MTEDIRQEIGKHATIGWRKWFESRYVERGIIDKTQQKG